MWALALTVFCGLAVLSGHTVGSGSGSEKTASGAAGPATPVSAAPGSTVTGSPATTDTGGQVVAAPMAPPDGESTDNGWEEFEVEKDGCAAYNEKRDFLPLNRWTSLSLHTVDNAWILKTRLFISMIASLMFMAAGLAWRIIGTLMGFGYSFDMICRAADPINSVVRSFSLYASWFLIPAWLFVLMAAVKRWTGNQRKGPASAMRMIMGFLLATGTIFFIGDQSDQHRDDPTAAYTVPWMAKTVQSWFGSASDSLRDLQKIGRFDNGAETNPVFYDTNPKWAGKVTCAALDKALYDRYMSDNGKKSSLGLSGSEAMVQVSKIWEMSLIRSWQTAQFGEGTEQYPSPAHASCRQLEANSSVHTLQKLAAYDLSTGNEIGTTTTEMPRGFYLDPPGDEKIIMVAWGACKGDDDGRGSNHTIPQWDKAKDDDLDDKSESCGHLYSSAPTVDTGDIWSLSRLHDGVDTFYFNGGDELDDKFGECYTSEEACRYSYKFVSAWLGANQVDRLTQGLMSLIVAFVFLFVLGPMAIGMTVSGVGLAGLVMILPMTLLLLGMGLPQGMRLLRLTGAAAAGDFLFTMGLTFLTMFTDTTYQAIHATFGDSTPNFFEQIAQGAAPLVALFLFRKISRILGIGDISTTTGAVGFAAAAVLKGSGDRRLARDSGRLMSRGLGRLGMGRMRLGALDERSLQRRMINNRATRGMTRATGRGVRRATRPLTDWVRDRYDAGRAGLRRGTMALQRGAVSGSPAQRAAAYTGLTAGMAGLTMLAPPAVLATLPLMAFTGGAAALRGGQAMFGGGRRGSGAGGGAAGLKPGAAAGMPVAKSWRAGQRQADDWHRNIIRVSDDEERERLIREHTLDGLNMLRARQWGAAHADGLNPEFTGFANDEEKMRARAEMARRMGLKPDQIMIGDHGLAIPVPPRFDRTTGRVVYPEDMTVDDFATNPYNFFDPYTLQRKMVNGAPENDDQFIARLAAQARERGYINDNGEYINVLAAHGIDTSRPEVRERVAHVISGGTDEEISRITITARRSEDTAVRTAREEWAQAELPGTDIRRQRDMEAVHRVAEAAQREIGDFRKIRVEMPDGGSGTAEELHLRLEQDLTRLMSVVAEVQDLHDANAAGFAGDFPAEFERLTGLQQEVAANIDRLSAQLRDAVDASASARGVCDLRVRLADPSTVMDTEELERVAEQITAQTRRAQQDWHETIERLAGSITRTPHTTADTDALIDALDEFRDTIRRRVDSEERDNKEVFDRLEDMRRSLESSRRMTQIDPRLTSSRPVDIRQLLREMYEREVTRN
ncbi:hypothetical protein ABZ801_18950 [Actinomadura sp. NPDC047616]|uniref:hypothetical protein n=1 Tax=Actinomadura sp. NPDC047616 TaxID=3155914 RepID=UPI0033F525DD